MEVCNTMTKQYNAHHINDIKNSNINHRMFDDTQEDDIKKAIGKIDPNSMAGPEGVSAKFFREKKESISVNLAQIFRKA